MVHLQPLCYHMQPLCNHMQALRSQPAANYTKHRDQGSNQLTWYHFRGERWFPLCPTAQKSWSFELEISKSGKSRGASNLKKWISRYYAYLNDFFGKKSCSSRFEKLLIQLWTLKSMGASDLERVPICKKVHVVRPQTLGALVFNGQILDKSRGAVNLKSEKT